ncbi:hypothetical protein [Rothia nasimurium]|uniref:hypothetical protein n=1 Tax=Rothia nasimurium TaxID=85336 RepID=UPI001F2AC3BE|nr:hypothetical protein [Rothia nasimurium]
MALITTALELTAHLINVLPIHEIKEVRREYRQQIDPITRKLWKEHMNLAQKQAVIYARAYIAMTSRKLSKKKR